MWEPNIGKQRNIFDTFTVFTVYSSILLGYCFRLEWNSCCGGFLINTKLQLSWNLMMWERCRHLDTLLIGHSGFLRVKNIAIYFYFNIDLMACGASYVAFGNLSFISKDSRMLLTQPRDYVDRQHRSKTSQGLRQRHPSPHHCHLQLQTFYFTINLSLPHKK